MKSSDRAVVPPMHGSDTLECHLIHLPAARLDEGVDVLAEAFRDYPVMLRVLGQPGLGPESGSSAAADFGSRLRRLVRFFVLARVLSGHPILALEARGRLLAVATRSLPEPATPDPELELVRAGTWAILGSDARARYEELGRMWGTFSWAEPHHHLNMIGVRRGWVGQGLGRRLLDEVHAFAARDPESSGVSLTTETASNVELYRHLGYRVVARGHLPAQDRPGLPEIRSWGMFRPTSD